MIITLQVDGIGSVPSVKRLCCSGKTRLSINSNFLLERNGHNFDRNLTLKSWSGLFHEKEPVKICWNFKNSTEIQNAAAISLWLMNIRRCLISGSNFFNPALTNSFSIINQDFQPELSRKQKKSSFFLNENQ